MSMIGASGSRGSDDLTDSLGDCDHAVADHLTPLRKLKRLRLAHDVHAAGDDFAQAHCGGETRRAAAAVVHPAGKAERAISESGDHPAMYHAVQLCLEFGGPERIFRASLDDTESERAVAQNEGARLLVKRPTGQVVLGYDALIVQMSGMAAAQDLYRKRDKTTFSTPQGATIPRGPDVLFQGKCLRQAGGANGFAKLKAILPQRKTFATVVSA